MTTKTKGRGRFGGAIIDDLASMNTIDIIEIFRNAIHAAGQPAPDVIETDGKLRRYGEKRGDDACWYVLHADGVPAGAYGSWRTGLSQSWRADLGRTLTPAEESAHRARLNAMKREREAEDARRRAEAARMAAAIWKAANPPTPENPYLLRKGVPPVPTLREIDADKAAEILGYAPKSRGELLTGRLLVAPVKVGDAVSTLELIDGEGRKSALYGGAKAGGYWAAQSLPEGDGDGLTLLVGEGVATMLSARAATKHPSIAALSCGNLASVAKQMRERYPAAVIVIVSDLGNGEKDAEAAARSCGALLAVPDFGADRPEGASDFNDMAQLCGLEAVTRAIAGASAPEAAKPQLDGDNATGGDPGVWPNPLPIPTMLLPVEPFNDALLPASLRAWVADIAERMQCPPDFPAVGAMVTLSSVIGRKACIAPKRHDDWYVIANLWGAVVGRPGVLKSPALSEIMKPLDWLAALASELHAEMMRDYEIRAKLDELAEKADDATAQKLMKQGKRAEAEKLLIAAANAESTAPPPLRRYKVTDATVEALGEILIENPWGTLLYRDELNGLLRSLDKQGQEGARAFYLQGYDGNQGYTFDRIMRGRNLHIRAVCIAMLGGIQPGKLQAYIHDAVSGGASDDGLLQRFGLLVWPDVTTEWKNVDRWPDTPAKTEAFNTFARLDALQPGIDAETGEAAPVVYRFAPDAQEIFEDWRAEFEPLIRSDEYHPAMQSHLSKYRKLVPALALVIALADGEDTVSAAAVVKALAWAEYLQSHAARAYAAGTRPATEGAAALLAKIRAGTVLDGFSPRDVYLKGWAHLGTPEDAKAAAQMLCDLHHLRRVEQRPSAGGGRPATVYRINPKTAGGA